MVSCWWRLLMPAIAHTAFYTFRYIYFLVFLYFFNTRGHRLHIFSHNLSLYSHFSLLTIQTLLLCVLVLWKFAPHLTSLCAPFIQRHNRDSQSPSFFVFLRWKEQLNTWWRSSSCLCVRYTNHTWVNYMVQQVRIDIDLNLESCHCKERVPQQKLVKVHNTFINVCIFIHTYMCCFQLHHCHSYPTSPPDTGTVVQK